MPVGEAPRRFGSLRDMTASIVRQRAEWTGRWLLLGAVAFWWGAIVAPRLVSLTLPELLPPEAIPRHLDPDSEGNLANAVSAIFLLITALLAFANALRSFGRLRTQDVSRRGAVPQAHGWIATGGWTTLAVTATFLAWEEIFEFKAAAGMSALGQMVLGTAYDGTRWPVLVSPLIVAFVLAMGVFVGKGLPSTGSTGSRQASSGREVRALLVLGLAAWLLAVVHEVGYTFVFGGKGALLARLLEETLEFGGTLVIGLSAGIALRELGPPSYIFGGRGRFPPAAWSMAAVAVVGCVAALAVVAAVVHRTPLADARARIHIGAFSVSLHDSLAEEHSLVQELGVLAEPVARLDLRVANHDPQGRSGTLLWRIMEAGEGGSGPLVREGRIEVPARDYLGWERIHFPPLAYAEGRRLMVQLVADVEPGAHLRIGATKTNRFEDGRLWINGALAWPDQNIEFAVYMASELTREKLRTMWGTFTSDWRWSVLTVHAAIVMTLITFIPALLITAALPRRG